MRVFVDARMLGVATSRGIGRVLYEFLRHLLLDPSIEWTVLVRHPEQLDGLPAPAQVMVADIPWYGIREQLFLPWLIWRSRADLVFFPHWNVPLFTWKPFVCFIHDLILLRHPHSTHLFRRHPFLANIKGIGQRFILRLVAHRARYLLVPTRFVANELAHFFPIAREKTRVVGEGVNLPDVPPSTRPFSGRYVLTVGSAYPHKRLDLVLEAWKTLSLQAPDLSLVMVGEMDGFRRDLMQVVEQFGLARVYFPGEVSDAELASWYSHADLLLFPSAAEGFGLPPLEALSYGCPVLASDLPVLREILPTEGVRFFRNGDASDILEKWIEVLHDLPRLRLEAKRGFAEAAARHVWAEAAERVRSSLRLA